MPELKIDQNFCFRPTKPITIKINSEALSGYAKGFASAFTFENDIPIILDANIILNYYGMANAEKIKLIEFINANKKRIYLTSQVETEYLKNRITSITKNFFVPIKSIPIDYEITTKDIINKFGSFVETKKNILSKDFPELWDEIIGINEQIVKIISECKLAEKLKECVSSITDSNKDLTVIDPMLDVCSTLNILRPLADDEVYFVIKQYDLLSKEFNDASEDNKWRSVFPGCGDKKQKEYPYGDFIIFHEILKFMKEKDSSVVFLTNEKRKGDWVNKDLSPIVHYIESAYLNTGQTLYVLNAEKPLEISLDNIHENKSALDGQKITREGWIYLTDKERGFGFIWNDGDNLYFNKNKMINPQHFEELKVEDYVRFKIDKNQEGKDIAVEIYKVSYHFDDPSLTIHKGIITSIQNKYGFVRANDRDYYFHKKTVSSGPSFGDLHIGDKVEFLVGLNYDGDDLIRALRKTTLTEEGAA